MLLPQLGFLLLNPQKLKNSIGENPMQRRTNNNYLFFFQERKYRVS